MSNNILLKTANKYLLNDIESACSPGGRFANILSKLETNGQLSSVLLEFLKHRGFHALHRLAAGKIPFTDYLPLAQKELDKRRLAEENEAKRRRLIYEVQEAEREKERRIKFIAECEASERERKNSARLVKYLINDIKNTGSPGDRLAVILEKLETNEKLSSELLEFLNRSGFHALHRLAAGKISFTDYQPLARGERDKRQVAAGKMAQQMPGRCGTEQRARKLSPRDQAKMRDNELRRQYGLDAFIARENYPKLMGLLRNLDKGSRISAEEFIWLSTQDDNNYERYLTTEIADRYHFVEANHLAAEFKRTGDPWHAVNASGHFRKCEKPKEADQLLSKIEISRTKGVKLQSALYTTNGGVKRDLREFDMALKMGFWAHELTPRDFRPCTLLGAVYYEQGNYEQGKTWYDKAVKRGFEESQVDYELKSIFRRLDQDKQIAMREHLLSLNPKRYKWANKNT